MSFKHAFGLLALNLLCQTRPTLAQEDREPLETGFRLMIFTGEPSVVQITAEGEDGVEWVGTSQDPGNEYWYPGAAERAEQGGHVLGYMGWTRPADKDRTVWIHNKGTDKESGRKVSQDGHSKYSKVFTIVFRPFEPRPQISETGLVHIRQLGTGL